MRRLARPGGFEPLKIALTWLSAGSNVLPTQADEPFLLRSDSADDLLLDSRLFRERR